VNAWAGQADFSLCALVLNHRKGNQWRRQGYIRGTVEQGERGSAMLKNAKEETEAEANVQIKQGRQDNAM
jgi:hypothetical protein